MTDKLIIDTTKCRYNTFDGGNTQRTICTIDGCFCDCLREKECYYKQLKRAENQIVDFNKMVEAKEQECETLGQAYLETNELLQEKTKECTNLKAKNDELKKINKANAKSYEKHWYKLEKYKAILIEIKEFVENEMTQNGDTNIILQKISGCEVKE